MKILITTYNSLGYGGAEVSVKLLAEGLIKKGNEVVIASSEEYEGLDTRIFKKFDSRFFKNHEKYLVKFFSKLLEEGFDVIYPQDRLTSVSAVLAAKKCGVKSVVHFRDYWFACPYSSCLAPDGFEYDRCNWKILWNHFDRKRFFWDLYKLKYLERARKILKLADYRIANSSAVKRRLEINGIQAEAIPILRDFNVKKGSLRLKKKYNLRNKVITFIGGLTYPKGIMNMVKIMPEILNEEISFFVVGGGPLINEVKGDGIVCTGKLDNKEIKDVYAASDLIVLPSLWQEPLSGILLEAASYKKAILSSDAGGSKDIMKDLVKKDDPEEWKVRIRELIYNDKLREKKALEWHKEAKSKYSVEKIAERIEKALKS